MKIDEVFELIDNSDFLEKIYGFAYRRCSTSFDAEDLCSNIIIAVISAIHKQNEINDFYAFAWSIARRVYADFCDKRNKRKKDISIENTELSLLSKTDDIEELFEQIAETEHLKTIFREISFLSKAYRDVMVMYYIDEIKIKDIAQYLNISENSVKQRLFSARNIIRKEVETMNKRNLSLKPIRLAISGTGNPCGNDPRSKAERMLSQNLIYLCKDKPKSAKELSDELCIPMSYVEEELEIQCRGENGSYGMLRKLDNEKYALNILLVDYSEYNQANRIYEKRLPEYCKLIIDQLKRNEKEILEFPYLSQQNHLNFILWALISRTVWDFQDRINKVIMEKYFRDIIPINRSFSCVAVAFTDEQNPNFGFYGSDGIDATQIGGYKSVFVSNIYGERLDKHFYCGYNIAHDDMLLMLIRAIGGLNIDDLTESEKEIAAKAIECGYLRKKGHLLEPRIIVIDKKDDMDFYNLSFKLNNKAGELVEEIAEELSQFMREHIPEHLISEYQIYTQLIAGIRILSGIIEELIKKGLLLEPENRLGAEGMLMVVNK